MEATTQAPFKKGQLVKTKGAGLVRPYYGEVVSCNPNPLGEFVVYYRLAKTDGIWGGWVRAANMELVTEDAA